MFFCVCLWLTVRSLNKTPAGALSRPHPAGLRCFPLAGSIPMRLTAPLWFLVGTLRSIVLPRDTDYGKLMLPINMNALDFAEYAVGVQEGEEAT